MASLERASVPIRRDGTQVHPITGAWLYPEDEWEPGVCMAGHCDHPTHGGPCTCCMVIAFPIRGRQEKLPPGCRGG